MDIALCYESVLPARGGAETYIGDLARGSRATATPSTSTPAGGTRLAAPRPRTSTARRASGPRFLPPVAVRRGVRSGRSRAQQHDVSIGFDKTWGQDVLYPQGGLHAASAAHNLLKFPAASRARWRRSGSGSTRPRGRSRGSNASSTSARTARSSS